MIKRMLHVAAATLIPLTASADIVVNQINRPAIENYLKTIVDHFKKPNVAEGWDWFAHRSHSTSGIPMILVKLLPELDPEIFGPPSEKFSRFGHYLGPKDEARDLPTSLGMSSFPTAADPDPIIVTTETCATCHMGQVKLKISEKEVLPLYGGVNVKFDIRKWRTAIEQMVAKHHLDNNADINNTAQTLRGIVEKKDPGYFLSDRKEDKVQRDHLMKPGGAEAMLKELISWQKLFTRGKQRQRATSYLKTQLNNPPNIDEGYPGKVDASGDLIAQQLHVRVGGMPSKASLTDIPSAWMQIEYSSGQWDGSITNVPKVKRKGANPNQGQIIRNMAAEIAVAPSGWTVDRRVANYALNFVHELPAPKFPFLSSRQGPALEELRKQGAALFATNCAECHHARNDRYYPEVGTDLSRATVMTTLGTLRIGEIFEEACWAKLPDGTSPFPCGHLFDYVRGSNPAETGGPSYPAKPLTGLWARAPYLHNGSVPTLKHLLMSDFRPQRFVVGSINYDSEAVGFAWDPEHLDEYKKDDPYADIMDTSQDSLSNQGHDQDALVLDGKTYRLDWSDRPAEAEALLEYLKTL